MNINYVNNFKQNQPNFARNTSVSVFSINDLHGQNMHGIKKASDSFDEFCKEKSPDASFKVSSGDIMMGTPDSPIGNSRIWTKFLNLIKLDVSAIGNHELELSNARFAEEVKNSDFKYLAANINFKQGTELKKLSDNKTLLKSCVIEKNGEKYGFIGLCPLNLNDVVCKESKVQEEMQINNLPETIEAVNNEVNNLKKQTNKIILLSHLGYKLKVHGQSLKTAEKLAESGCKIDINYDSEGKTAVINPDKIIAENTKEIDIINGGHSHDLLAGIKEDRNLFYNLDNKPVIITQAGRDGQQTNTLNAVFDENGELIISECENIINEVDNSTPSNEVMELRKQNLGNPTPLAQTSQTMSTPSNPRAKENKVACLVADAMRYATGAQIALINAGNIRGSLFKTPENEGIITSLDIKDVALYPQKLYKVQLSEKALVGALNKVADSFKSSNPRPGLLHTSGLEYKVSKDGNLLEAFLVKDNNEKEQINIKNPSDSKKFSTVCIDYLFNGGDGFTALKTNLDLEQFKKSTTNKTKPEGFFNINQAEATIQYLSDVFPFAEGKIYSPNENSRAMVI